MSFKKGAEIPQQELPAPTSAPERIYPKAQKILKIVSVFPESKYLQSLSVASQIIITFGESINPTSLTYEITPSISVLTELDSTATKLSFKPRPFWKPDEKYTLVIKKVNGQRGSVLVGEYRIEFKAVVSSGE